MVAYTLNGTVTAQCSPRNSCVRQSECVNGLCIVASSSVLEKRGSEREREQRDKYATISEMIFVRNKFYFFFVDLLLGASEKREIKHISWNNETEENGNWLIGIDTINSIGELICVSARRRIFLSQAISRRFEREKYKILNFRKHARMANLFSQRLGCSWPRMWLAATSRNSELSKLKSDQFRSRLNQCTSILSLTRHDGSKAASKIF